MKTADFPTIGTLNTTLPTPGDPSYQTEALALVLHQTIKDLSDNGFQFQQAEGSDFTSFGGDTQDAIDDYQERLDDILRTGTTEVVANLPDVLPIIGALLSGGSEPVLAILLQGVLDTVLRQFDTRVDVADGEPNPNDMTAVVASLDSIDAKLETGESVSITDTVDTLMEAIRGQIETTLNEFTINLHASEIDTTWSVGPLAE